MTLAPFRQGATVVAVGRSEERLAWLAAYAGGTGPGTSTSPTPSRSR